MNHQNDRHLRMGIYASRLVFITGVIYAAVTLAGLLMLPSPSAPVGQPFVSIMEILILLIAPLMAISLVAVHYTADTPYRPYSLVSVCLMFLMTGITSGVHFVMLTIGYHQQITHLPGYAQLFSFQWPSLVYALDILAWDWFFPLSLFFAAVLFRRGSLEKTIRWLMIISGILSLAGLAGIPTGNMQIRNIGIIGYAVTGPVVFLLTGVYLKRKSEGM